MKTKNLLKKAFLLLALMGGASSAWGDETIFSATVIAECSVPASTTDAEITGSYATISGGTMYVTNDQSAAKSLLATAGSKKCFSMTNSGTKFKVVLSKALQEGDKINGKTYNNSGSAANRGIFLSTAGSRPSSCTASLIKENAGSGVWEDLPEYTVTAGDGICGQTTFYIYRGTGNTTYFYDFTITRAAVAPGAISFSPAAGSVAAGASVTLASSGASTIVYQWGASAIGEGGDWSGAVTYSGETKPVVPAAGSANTVLSVKATNANGSTYGSAAYTPVKMALKTIYSFADGIGSQEVAAADATITGTTEMKLSDTNGRITLTPTTGKFENGDAIEFSGSVGNISRDYGIKYGTTTSIANGNLYVAAGQPCHVSGTLSLDEATSDLYIGRYGGTTTYFNTFTIRRLVAATSEAFTGVKIGGSAATEDVDYTIDGSTITLTGTFTVEPNVALVNHIVFADESVEDQNLLVAFGAPNGEFYTGTVTIDGTTYTVKAPCGQINALKVEYKDGGTTIKEENLNVTGLKVGASYTVPFRMYVEKDGALYQTTKNGSDPWYGDVVTLAYNTTVTKTVTPVDLGGGTLELLEDLDDSGDNGASTRASNCSAYINKGYTSASNLPAGKYKFIFRVENINDRDSYIKVGDTEVYRTKSMAKGAWNDIELNDVIIPADGALTLAKSGSAYDGYDILIAIRTGDAVVNITPANAWSTYVTPYALDFSDVEGGLKAYVATAAAAGKVTLDPVGAVPAGTPLMLVGTASTEYTVPVIAPVSAPETNMFRAGDGTTEFNAESTTSYDYILFTDGKFYRIATDTTVPVGKAYLHCTSDPTTPLARELRISFGDNITGIEQIDNGQLTIDNSQPVKRIVKGKLVIQKNGVKYNAAGAQVK